MSSLSRAVSSSPLPPKALDATGTKPSTEATIDDLETSPSQQPDGQTTDTPDASTSKDPPETPVQPKTWLETAQSNPITTAALLATLGVGGYTAFGSMGGTQPETPQTPMSSLSQLQPFNSANQGFLAQGDTPVSGIPAGNVQNSVATSTNPTQQLPNDYNQAQSMLDKLNAQADMIAKIDSAAEKIINDLPSFDTPESSLPNGRVQMSHILNGSPNLDDQQDSFHWQNQYLN